jgi:hypothetical protein
MPVMRYKSPSVKSVLIELFVIQFRIAFFVRLHSQAEVAEQSALIVPCEQMALLASLKVCLKAEVASTEPIRNAVTSRFQPLLGFKLFTVKATPWKFTTFSTRYRPTKNFSYFRHHLPFDLKVGQRVVCIVVGLLVVWLVDRCCSFVPCCLPSVSLSLSLSRSGYQPHNKYNSWYSNI